MFRFASVGIFSMETGRKFPLHNFLSVCLISEEEAEGGREKMSTNARERKECSFVRSERNETCDVWTDAFQVSSNVDYHKSEIWKDETNSVSTAIHADQSTMSSTLHLDSTRLDEVFSLFCLVSASYNHPVWSMSSIWMDKSWTWLLLDIQCQ